MLEKVYLTFYDSQKRYCTLKFGSKEQAATFESKIKELIAASDEVQTKDLVVGQGDPIENGDMARIQYVGWLENEDGSKGAKFDENTEEKPYVFEIGQPGAIKGMQKGVLGMARKGKREIRIPPSMGYGPQGSPPKIPPHASLIFEVQLLRIKRGVGHKPAPAAQTSQPEAQTSPRSSFDERVRRGEEQMIITSTPPAGGIKAVAQKKNEQSDTSPDLGEEPAGQIVVRDVEPTATQTPAQTPAQPAAATQPAQAAQPQPNVGFPAQGYPYPQVDVYGRPYPPMPPPAPYYQPAAQSAVPSALPNDGPTKYQMEAVDRKLEGMTGKMEELLREARDTRRDLERRVHISPGSHSSASELMLLKDAEGISGEMLVAAVERLVEENNTRTQKGSGEADMYKEHMDLLREKSADLKERNETLKIEVARLKAQLVNSSDANAEITTAREAEAAASKQAAALTAEVGEWKHKAALSEEKLKVVEGERDKALQDLSTSDGQRNTQETESREHIEKIASLTADIEVLRSKCDQHDAESGVAKQLAEDLQAANQQATDLQAQVDVMQNKLQASEANLAKAEGAAADSAELQESTRKVQELQEALQLAEQTCAEQVAEAIKAKQAVEIEIEELKNQGDATLQQEQQRAEEMAKVLETTKNETVTLIKETEVRLKEETKLLMESVYELFSAKLRPEDQYAGSEVMKALRSIVKKKTKALLKDADTEED